VPQDAIDTVASPPGRLVAGDSTIVNGLVPLYNASGATGRYTVRLSGAPNRCTEAAGFSRTVTVLPGDTAIAGYAVRCVERLHVATATTGPGTDLDGYDIVIENQDGTADTVRTGLNDTAHIAGVSPGPHTIRLADVETSCLAPAQVTPTISGLDSTLLRFQVSCPAPPPPGGLRTTLVTTSQIDIAWDSAGPDSVIAGYRIYRNGALYDSTAATAYSDPGLPAFTSFTYRISSVNRTGLEGARSGPLVVRTRDATPPTAPAALTATPVSGTRINLGWSAATDPETGVARYRIYRDGILTDSTAATAYADTGLVPSTLYSYQVAAVNPDGLEGPRSPAAQATTLDVTPPSAPGSLSATAVSASRIDLSWSAASDPESGVIRYNVYRNGIQAGTATGTSFSDVNLVPNTAYSYTVTAVNGAALEGPPSQPATATTLPDPSPPTAPTGLSASPVSSSRIDLSWNAAGDPESGVSRYRIYRDGLLADSSTTTSYADTGLTPSTTYTYTVSAVNGAGLEGPASAPAGATTPGDLTPPTAPTGLTATATGTSSIDLAWTAASDPETGIARYRIYRDGALVDSTGGTGFSDAGLTPATAYTYEVSAVNGAGLEGPRSQPATATTLPVVTTGELLVNVTTGGTIPQNPFEVLLEGSVRRTAPVTPNGTALFTGLTPGAYEVRLRNLAAGCAVTPPNPRGTTIVAGQQTQTTFAVTCQ
ncbi:MAG: fibronectin type III domain-containing protein, partial [Gemmatimonadales bacterium]